MTGSTDLPLAGLVAWWGTAWLRGLIAADELLDVLGEEYAAQVLVGRDEGLLEVLRSGSAVAASFPAPGDPAGLAGPPAFTAASIDAGQTVLVLDVPREPGIGLVPREVGRAVEWVTYDARRRPPPDLGDADRVLRATLVAAANDLARLDVARWRPEVADALHDLRAGTPLVAPPGVPERALDLARRALHVWAVADLALADDGGAVSAGEMAARRDVVLPLGRAARHALTAACSPDGWPPR